MVDRCNDCHYFTRAVGRGYSDFLGIAGVRVPGERDSSYTAVHLVLYDHGHVTHQRLPVVPAETVHIFIPENSRKS